LTLTDRLVLSASLDKCYGIRFVPTYVTAPAHLVSSCHHEVPLFQQQLMTKNYLFTWLSHIQIGWTPRLAGTIGLFHTSLAPGKPTNYFIICVI